MTKPFSPFSEHELIPQEEKIDIKVNRRNLVIGIPRETYFEEKRVCLTPDAVNALCQNGHQVLIETQAGIESNYDDKEYADAGAKICYSSKEVFESPVVLKIAPPSIEELNFIKPNTIIFSSIQLKTQNKAYFECLAKKKITAIGFDFFRDENGVYPIVKSLSEIAGTASVLIGAELMSNTNKGNGLLLGNVVGVPPCEVVVLGAGTVGEYASKAAIGLGASVKVFCNNMSKLRHIQDAVNHPIYTSTFQPKNLIKALRRCDILIGAIRGNSRSPVMVTEDMVKKMKEGAVIVDVSIDRGGCVETSEITTHSKPTLTKHGVIHYCVPNIPSRYARTASLSLSNILTPFLTGVAEHGGFEEAFHTDRMLRNGVYMYKGILTNKSVAEWFNLPFRDINLLFI